MVVSGPITLKALTSGEADSPSQSHAWPVALCLVPFHGSMSVDIAIFYFINTSQAQFTTENLSVTK